MHIILWRFRARPGHEAEFEAAYGEGGVWSRFFREGRGFLGSDLLRASDGTYLTMDRWESGDAYRAFRESHANRYAEIDSDCHRWTVEETSLGEIET